jgi:hypothetical protein
LSDTQDGRHLLQQPGLAHSHVGLQLLQQRYVQRQAWVGVHARDHAGSPQLIAWYQAGEYVVQHPGQVSVTGLAGHETVAAVRAVVGHFPGGEVGTALIDIGLDLLSLGRQPVPLTQSTQAVGLLAIVQRPGHLQGVGLGGGAHAELLPQDQPVELGAVVGDQKYLGPDDGQDDAAHIRHVTSEIFGRLVARLETEADDLEPRVTDVLLVRHVAE